MSCYDSIPAGDTEILSSYVKNIHFSGLLVFIFLIWNTFLMLYLLVRFIILFSFFWRVRWFRFNILDKCMQRFLVSRASFPLAIIWCYCFAFLFSTDVSVRGFCDQG